LLNRELNPKPHDQKLSIIALSHWEHRLQTSMFQWNKIMTAIAIEWSRSNFMWKGTSPPNIVGVRKRQCLEYLTVKTVITFSANNANKHFKTFDRWQHARRMFIHFEPLFWGLRGNVRTSSIARWKAPGRLPIRDNWTFFAISYGWDVISRYWSKSALFRGGWSIWAQILSERGRRPSTIVGVRKLERFCYLTVLLHISLWKLEVFSLHNYFT